MEHKPEKKEKTKPKSVKYIGKGHFITGVPARDMTWEMWNTLPEIKRADAIRLGLYEVIK